MNVIRGDLIKLAQEGAFDVIVHGCNCRCAMEKGIAKGVREAFPAAYQLDQATELGDRAKLGTIGVAEVEVGDHELAVVNAYTQFDFEGAMPLADYEAIRGAFAAIKKRFAGRRIGYPMIGAGLAGGDWVLIAAIIDAELAGEDHTLVEFTG
ncbi:MAG: O-acetyl-ADP-ribose deacetylase (regulator of RNase III) [Planctomycetota bacterium]|jgi:O-acetyl-ADP-ribose deacetylase (regulator of RNase III)